MSIYFLVVDTSVLRGPVIHLLWLILALLSSETTSIFSFVKSCLSVGVLCLAEIMECKI